MISHRADKLTFDGNFELWRNEDVYVSLYSTLNITQTESVRDLPSKLHVRVHHKNDAIVSLGVEDYDITKSGAPDVLSALALYGGDVTNEVRAFGGIYSGFKLSTSTLLFHKYLLGIKHKDVTGYLELAAGDVEMKLIDKITKHVTFKKEWQNDMTLRLMGTPSSTFRVGGDLAYNFQSTALNTRLYAHYDIDKDTFFKARWTHKDETLTLSLNHNFRGLITFGVTGKVTKGVLILVQLY